MDLLFKKQRNADDIDIESCYHSVFTCHELNVLHTVNYVKNEAEAQGVESCTYLNKIESNLLMLRERAVYQS